MKRASLIRGIVGLIAIVGIVVGVPRLNFLSLGSKTAYAVGDLSIDWGVPSGDPIFTITSMSPGQSESRSVDVTNSASTSRPIGVRGILTASSGTLADSLEITVTVGGADLYGGTSPTGPKTLTEFFADSAGPSGIPLLTLAPGGSTTLVFTVAFPDAASNEFQGGSVTMDLSIGLSFETPEACSDVVFDGAVIFGTERGDRLNGTDKNDFIIGFEGGDSIRAGKGDDCVVGGPGGDSLRGGEGDDVIEGGEGSDGLRGAEGNDHLIGGPGSDTLRGDQGNDTLEGGEGSDGLRGGAGNDHLMGGPGNDSLRGDKGDDELVGQEGSDSARGGAGTDTCDAEVELDCEL